MPITTKPQDQWSKEQEEMLQRRMDALLGAPKPAEPMPPQVKDTLPREPVAAGVPSDFNLTDSVTRFGKRLGSNIGGMAMGLGELLVKGPTASAIDASMDAAAQVAQGKSAALHGAEAVTGLPVTQMREDLQAGNYPETAADLTTVIGSLLLPKGIRATRSRLGGSAVTGDRALLKGAIDANAQPATGSTGSAVVDSILQKHSADSKIYEPTLVKTKAGAKSTPTGEVPLSESKVLARQERPTPTALRVGPSKTVELPADPFAYAEKVNARTIEGAPLPREVAMQLSEIDARPSRVPREWLDSTGKPITDEAVAGLNHERLQKELAKTRVMERFYASQETKPVAARQKAEASAERENLRSQVGGTDISKIKATEAKTQEKARKEIVEKEKAHTVAAKMVEGEKRQAAAQRAIDTAIEQGELVPDPPVVRETTVGVPTAAGKQTLSQTFRPKPEPDEFAGVDLDAIAPPPMPSPSTPKPVIPKTDPKVVAQTVFPTRIAAMDAAAGSGQRVKEFQKIGRGKHRVIFERDVPVKPVTPKAEPQAPEAKFKLPEVKNPEQALDAALSNDTLKANPMMPKPITDDVYQAGIDRRRAAGVSPTGVERRGVVGTKAAIEADVNTPIQLPRKVQKAPGAPKTPAKGAVAPVQEKPAVAPAKALEQPAKPTTSMSRQQIDALTREDVAKWTPDELSTAQVKWPKDKRLQTIITDELNKRNTAPTAPVKAAEPAKPVQPQGYKDSYEKMAVESSLPQNTVKIDLEGAKNASEVKNRVVNTIQEYRQKVQKYEDSRGVDEQGKYTYSEANPGPLSVHVPGGPTYTIQPDLTKIDNVLSRFDKGLSTKGYEGVGKAQRIDPDEAFQGIVDKAERPTHTKISTGYGSNFGAKEGQAPSVTLPIGPEKKGAIPAKGKAPLEADAPKANLNDLVLQEKQAWDNYWNLKETKAAPEEIRAAGKAAGELRAQLAQAAKDAEARGEAVPSYATKPAKAKAPEGKGPTNEDIAKLSPAEQEAKLQEIVKEFKGKKSRIKNEKGEFNPELAVKLGLGATGAAVGATQTPDDPLFGALLGGTAGWFGPTVFKTLYSYKNNMSKGKARTQAENTLGQQVKDWAHGALQVAPDYLRASYLARLPNLALNAWAGPYGAATMGAIEAAIAGDARGWKALDNLYNPKKWPANAKDYFVDSMNEAGSRVTDAMERGDIASAEELGTGALKKVITAPARTMTAGDIAARKILMNAGFTEPEARALTLTSEPHSGLAKSIGAFRKAKGAKGSVSVISKLMLPFYRTAINQVEQSALRTPVGNALREHWNIAPAATRKLLVQSGITGVVGIGSFQLGANADPVSAPITVKFLNNFFGPYGATASAMFLAGVASQKADTLSALPKGLTQYITNGLPLPTLDVFKEGFKSVEDLATKGEINLPYGVVPPPLSSKVPVSVPTGVRYLTGDPEWKRPTKGEYGPVPFVFSDKPKLQPKPKTEHERKIEQMKQERARQRKAMREAGQQ